MKMSTFPLPSSGYPNLASTQLLMSAASGLNLQSVNGGSGSPKDGSSAPTTPQFPGLPNIRLPGLSEQLSSPNSGTPAAYLPPHLVAMASMADPRILYSALQAGNGGAPYDVKENTDTLLAYKHYLAAQMQAAASSGMLPYDSHAASFPYACYPGMDLNGVRRKNATRETTSTLKAWLYEHRKNPYPTKGEKIMLAIMTKMTLTQVSTWFANARRRLKKENKMTWSPRNRTDDGSDEGDEKVDDDAGDDISIDLSDFESDASPTKTTEKSFPKLTTSEPQMPVSTSTTTTQSPAESPMEKDPPKPRIWSLADVATSKPSQPAAAGPVHHQSASLRHRPYPIPNSSSSFKPWFDANYRPMAGHPIMANPLIPLRPNINQTSLRIPIAHSLPSQITHPRSPTVSNGHSTADKESDRQQLVNQMNRQNSRSSSPSLTHHSRNSVSPTGSNSSH